MTHSDETAISSGGMTSSTLATIVPDPHTPSMLTVQSITTSVTGGSGGLVDMADLYPDTQISAGLRSALAQLDDIDGLLVEGLGGLRDEGIIASDDAVQRAQAVLRELFCFRWLGDGFGQVIGALNLSLSNQDGLPLTAEQIGVLRGRIRKVREEPFLSDQTAAQEVEQLAEGGLNPFATELFAFADVGDDDSVR